MRQYEISFDWKYFMETRYIIGLLVYNRIMFCVMSYCLVVMAVLFCFKLKERVYYTVKYLQSNIRNGITRQEHKINM